MCARDCFSPDVIRSAVSTSSGARFWSVSARHRRHGERYAIEFARRRIDPMYRRKIVYDVFVGAGPTWTVARGLSVDEAQAAKELLQDVRLEPRIVPDPDLDRDQPSDWDPGFGEPEE